MIQSGGRSRGVQAQAARKRVLEFIFYTKNAKGAKKGMVNLASFATLG
ncbi:MAG: hypothetical protein DUW69_001837 [Verrucomicrobia bacterium]|jgi:hypothetical protein|nr:MAG: hypothetical protein DUW69_001837 [Verrucomicrobiota bacterium]